MNGTRTLPGTVVLGSTSPAKLAAVRLALAGLRRDAAFSVDLLSVAAPSGVPEQPWGDAETRTGALNRATAALALTPAAGLAVGIEAGVAEEPGWPLWTFSWVVAVARDGTVGTARSASFGLPQQLEAGVRAGLELGDALDAAYGLSRAKDSLGAVGVLTGGLMDRSQLYRDAVVLALMPWLAPAVE